MSYETCFNERRQAVLNVWRTKTDLPKGTLVETVKDRLCLWHPAFPPAPMKPYEPGASRLGDKLAEDGSPLLDNLQLVSVPEVTQRDDGALVFDDGFTVLSDGSTTHERSEA